MPKRVLAFDLDGTLAPSKSTLPPRMSAIFTEILKSFQVCVISGGKFGQFDTQLLRGLSVGAEGLTKLHIMPTCGTQYYRYEIESDNWQQVYAENFSELEKKNIIAVVNEAIDNLGYREAHPYGEIIEDRGSQITFSALGQDIVAQLGSEGVRLKEQWDPNHIKKNTLRDYIAEHLPECEVRVGGGTSIDITQPGIDKAYGMRKLIEILGIQQQDILFFGDRLQVGGNDYPVREMGITSLEVGDWEDTAARLETILALVQ